MLLTPGGPSFRRSHLQIWLSCDYFIGAGPATAPSRFATGLSGELRIGALRCRIRIWSYKYMQGLTTISGLLSATYAHGLFQPNGRWHACFGKSPSMLRCSAYAAQISGRSVDMEPGLTTDPELVDILVELSSREPIFHRSEFGITRADFRSRLCCAGH